MKQEEFIATCKRRHTIQYEYSKTIYTKPSSKITIICPKHGEFLQVASNHLRGQDCHKCNIERPILTWEQFLQKSTRIHDGKFSYPSIPISGKIEKKTALITIKCPIHGNFQQKLWLHLKGNGCEKCRRCVLKEYKGSNTTDFIIKAKKIHGEKYDYSKVNYISNRSKVKIICPTHGTFFQKPNDHLGGHGCAKCGFDYWRTSQEDFIKKATEIHHEKYDYSKVSYVNSYTKVIIKCHIHGYFKQKPQGHLLGKGCRQCSIEAQRGNLEDFIRRAREVHGDLYDYSKSKYVNNDIKVTIICKKHGKFLQRVTDHLDGNGCHKCAVDRMRSFLEEFIKISTRVHHGKYDYSKSIYVNSTEKIEIICPKHGSFWQIAISHKKGQGCPSCYSSMGENVIEEELILLGANYKKQVSFEGCRNKNKLRFDFGVYSKNDELLFLIEFQGIQHYKSIPYFGGQKSLEYTQKRDNIKRLYCSQHNMPLLEISYKDISNTHTLISNKYQQYASQRNYHTSQASSR